MKNFLTIITLFFTSTILACGGGWYGISFYSLFKQTNISAEEFYPFLRDEYNHFYGDNKYYEDGKVVYPKGNINLWKEILNNWSKEEIEKAVYDYNNFDWKNKNSKLEKNAKTYLEFAHECSDLFNHRNIKNSWNYDEAIFNSEHENIDTKALLSKANTLLNKEKNAQLKARYYYQIIRIFHYTEEYSDAIVFFESKVEDKLVKNEIYYYILDQVAGCHYSAGNHDMAAYYFTKVLNKSIDRKKSAYNSFNFCTIKHADGEHYSKGIEDEKDLLLIKSLRDFSDEVNNIKKFIALDANDNRIELLFMRAMSNLEQKVWATDSFEHKKQLPYLDEKGNHDDLLKIAEQQMANATVKNKDFWMMSSSYLSFINQDITAAKSKLKAVKTFSKQKKILNIVYEVFTWKTINPENENYISKVLLENPKKENNIWINENDWRLIILDKIGHTYYKNNEIAKAFLVHKKIENTNKLQSLELLNALEKFYLKTNKSDYEKQLLKANIIANIDYLDYINYQKGVYYLYEKNPTLALEFFTKNKTYKGAKTIPAKIFSNNIKECFECPESDVMNDQVYKASVFSFIKKEFSRKELAENLIALEKLRHDETQWKVKLANYLLGNYYFNISNTGYYRGLLTSNSNCCSYHYIKGDKYKAADQVIKNKEGYNLSTIEGHEKDYFGLSTTAMNYYQKTIDLSTDKELNARCLYLMAKCELNSFYNLGSTDVFEVKVNEYYTLKLPQYKSFKTLEEDYSTTEFYDMIIGECSYFRLYSSQ